MTEDVPLYQKPDAPGVWMNFDNTVSVYFVVEPQHTFETAAQGIFEMLKDAQQQFPDWPRILFLDVIGHTDDLGRLEDDMVELQQEFLFSVAGPFVTALSAPLVSALNPELQNNTFPDRLRIGPPDPGYKASSCSTN